MAQQATTPRPDVTDLFAVHGVFRDTLGAAPDLVRSVEPGDVGRLALVANYYENVLSFLESHHDGEETLVFPLLRERCPGEGALLDRLAAEHEEAVRLMANAEGALAAWSGGDARAQSEVANALEALRMQLDAHLDEEEAEGLSLCAENLSREEWGALPGYGMAHFGGDKIWLILGLIRQRMNDAQRADMLEHMPPPAVEMWTGFGEQAFNDLSSQVAVEVRSTVPG
jgi:hemerythrin-like domain-containing protein